MKYIIGILGLAALGLGAWQVLHKPTLNDNPTEISENVIPTEQTLTVSASIYPLAYITQRITGPLATVNNIGGNSDPHDFRPSVQDIQTMQDSDLMILQGAELEPWGEEVARQLKQNNVPLLIASEQVSLHTMEEHEDHHDHETNHKQDNDHHDEHRDTHAEEDGHSEEHGHNDHHEEDHKEADEHGHHHGEFDPHTWLDPVLTQEVVTAITERLSQLDPANASIYTQNAAQLKQDLSLLDQEYQSKLSKCKLDEVITSHDAFGYLARRYGFTIHSIAGLSTQDTPSAVTMAQLKEEAAEGIKAILLEENSVSAYGETLARETSLQTLPISPIVSIKQGDDYLTVARSNLRTLETALGCNE